MFKKEKIKDRKSGLYEEIKKILPDTAAEQTLCAFRFNLHRDEPEKRCDGIFYADKEYIRVVSD